MEQICEILQLEKALKHSANICSSVWMLYTISDIQESIFYFFIIAEALKSILWT